MSKISLIVAASTNNVIGKDNDMVWYLPTDLKNFKKVTNLCVVIMGRKCWDSLPARFRPLPNRLNYVVTRNKDFKNEGVIVKHDLIELLEFFKYADNDDEIFVIGGGEIYKEAFKYADKLYLTSVLEHVSGDVYLEGFNADEWVLQYQSDIINENDINFRFEEYGKKV